MWQEAWTSVNKWDSRIIADTKIQMWALWEEPCMEKPTEIGTQGEGQCWTRSNYVSHVSKTSSLSFIIQGQGSHQKLKYISIALVIFVICLG